MNLFDFIKGIVLTTASVTALGAAWVAIVWISVKFLLTLDIFPQ